MPVQILVHDAPGLAEPVIGGQVYQKLIHPFVVFSLEQLGDIIDNTLGENALPLIELLFIP